MITKFKIFEHDFPVDGYWLLNNPTSERLEAAGYKLDLSDEEIEFLKTHELIPDEKGIFLAPWYKPSYSPKSNVSWNRYDRLGSYSYKGNGLKFQGELIITDEDIKNIGFLKRSRKFNL